QECRRPMRSRNTCAAAPWDAIHWAPERETTRGSDMKLVRYGKKGAEKPGLIDEAGTLRDLSGEIDDFHAHLMTLELTERLSRLDTAKLPAVDGDPRLGPPIARPGHFIAIGLNYADHAAESGAPVPAE